MVEVLEVVLVKVVVDVEMPGEVRVVSIEDGVYVADGTTTVGATYTVAVELIIHPTS
jgi:hypothetical protein